jgi:hypothetical protein
MTCGLLSHSECRVYFVRNASDTLKSPGAVLSRLLRDSEIKISMTGWLRAVGTKFECETFAAAISRCSESESCSKIIWRH